MFLVSVFYHRLVQFVYAYLHQKLRMLGTLKSIRNSQKPPLNRQIKKFHYAGRLFLSGLAIRYLRAISDKQERLRPRLPIFSDDNT